MRPIVVVGLLLSVLVFTPLGAAQEELPPPPADWGELAQLLVENWGLEVCPNPTGGHPCINSLNLRGVGKNAYDLIMGIEGEDTCPCSADGYDPDNWPPEEELTGEFMCKLKMVVWAAAMAGMIPYYEVPVSPGPEEPLTPEEEALAKELAEEAVTDLVMTARRDGVCENGGGDALCYYCAGRNGPCWWGSCD